MEGHELLNRMDRVKAPADFEERVFRKLGEARRARARRRAAFRYAFAGSAAVLLIGFVLFNQSYLSRTAPMADAGRGKGESPAWMVANPASAPAAASASYLPVLETVDYSSEMRNASTQPRTVYILEQVSEVRPSEIKY
jgi:hypothetical protein